MSTNFKAFLVEAGLTQEQMDSTIVDYIPDVDGHAEMRKSDIHGFGMFARWPLPAGIIFAKAKIGDKWTQTGRFMNHSASPNTKAIKWSGNIAMQSTSRIPKDTEITCDYRQMKEVLS